MEFTPRTYKEKFVVGNNRKCNLLLWCYITYVLRTVAFLQMCWSFIINNSSRVCTGDDKAQVRGAHLQAMLLQLGHVQLQALVLPVQLVSHDCDFTSIQIVHDLLRHHCLLDWMQNRDKRTWTSTSLLKFGTVCCQTRVESLLNQPAFILKTTKQLQSWFKLMLHFGPPDPVKGLIMVSPVEIPHLLPVQPRAGNASSCLHMACYPP